MRAYYKVPRVIGIILLLIVVSGCAWEGSSGLIDDAIQASSSPFPVTEQLAETPTAGQAAAASRTPTKASATATAAPRPTEKPTASVSPVASPTVIANRSHEVARELAQAVPPSRDDVRLAVAFNGLVNSAVSAPVAVVEPLSPGQRESFTVLDVVNNTYSEIEAQLYAVGDHAYFWFETGPFGLVPEEDVLARVVSVFDDIYVDVSADFGKENSPGIDGDPRLHVLHASPQTICGVAPDGEGGCGTAGFVSSPDLQPALLNPQSNEREMFIMNDRHFGTDYYLGVLAHEFRHLIEFNYDLSDTDWEKEGSAVLATELIGLPSGGVDRANMFLDNPDQQLNSWSEDGKGPYYGQGFLFNQYLYDRLGESLYREYAMNPYPGFVALDDISNRNGLDFSGESLWLDWLAALVLHEHEQAGDTYKINLEGLNTAALTAIDSFPTEMNGEVRQFAADYYELPSGTINVAFAGEEIVPLLSGQEPTDEVFWYAQRANYSNPRLTRTLDLRSVEAATLFYDVYTDIEQGYDFAYVSVSVDGGVTWIPLVAAKMGGLDVQDDPSGSALAPRFYTNRNQEWWAEQIDLTAYAGQEILLRFEIVTEAILTYSGLAVDNISVPEIGFADDGTGDGWTAEGFTRATSSLPQPWHLRVITFPDGRPLVNEVPVGPDGQTAFTVTSAVGQRRPVLIVAASAPMTLEPATYKLRVAPN